MSDASSFFRALYERYEGEAWMIYGPAKGPYNTATLLDEWEKEVRGKEDIYFRLCPVAEKPRFGRGVQHMSCALTFVWLDLDCGKHKSGKQYFPNKEEAIAWVKKYLPWSFIVDSGSGLHVYCVLSSPIYITDDASFSTAYSISQRFQQWAREMCPYDIDSTHDLARVLRVPGTIHSGVSKCVEILESSGTTVDPSLIEGLPVSKKLSGTATRASSSDIDFVLDPKCSVDINMLMQIFTVNPTIYEAWSGHREPKGTDRSPSAYRFSMISFLMHAGLEKQDVVNITIRYLIDQKKFSPDQLKLDRPEVWASEMMKCKVDGMTFDDIGEIIETSPQEKQIEAVAALMEFPDPSRLVGVSRFAVLSGDDDLKGMVLQLHIKSLDGSVYKVDLQNPTSRPDSRKVIFSATGIMLPHYSTKQAAEANRKWEQAMQVAWHAADVYDPVESNSADVLMTSIKAFINSGDMANSVDESRETGRPCKDGDVYVVPTSALNSYVRMDCPELRSNREMHAAVRELRKVGIEKRQQMHKGVRMACLLVPVRLVDEVQNAGI